MTPSRHRRIRISAPLIAILTAALLLALFVTDMLTVGGIIASRDWISRTQRLQALIDSMRAELLDAETAERDFFMTGRSEYREAYQAAVRTLPATLADLRAADVGRCRPAAKRRCAGQPGGPEDPRAADHAGAAPSHGDPARAGRRPFGRSGGADGLAPPAHRGDARSRGRAPAAANDRNTTEAGRRDVDRRRGAGWSAGPWAAAVLDQPRHRAKRGAGESAS